MEGPARHVAVPGLAPVGVGAACKSIVSFVHYNNTSVLRPVRCEAWYGSGRLTDLRVLCVPSILAVMEGEARR